MSISEKTPRSIVVYLSILFAIMMTALSYLVLKNAFFGGPKFTLAGYEIGQANSDEQVYIRWWSVPHIFKDEEWELCYAQVDEALDALNYVGKHQTEHGWHYAKVGNDYALFYCEGNRVRIVYASSDQNRRDVKMQRLRTDLVFHFRKTNSLDESRVVKDDGTVRN